MGLAVSAVVACSGGDSNANLGDGGLEVGEVGQDAVAADSSTDTEASDVADVAETAPPIPLPAQGFGILDTKWGAPSMKELLGGSRRLSRRRKAPERPSHSRRHRVN